MRGIFNDVYVICVLIFFIKPYCWYSFKLPQQVYIIICCGYSFELPRLVEAIHTSIHNISSTYAIMKKIILHGLQSETTKLLDCVLIGICAVIQVEYGICVKLRQKLTKGRELKKSCHSFIQHSVSILYRVSQSSMFIFLSIVEV